jgi:hypothetical protein
LSKLKQLELCDFLFETSVPLVFMPIFVPVPCWLYYCVSIVYFEVRHCDTYSVLFAQDCFGYLKSFVGNLRLNFLPLWRISLEFWWGLRWTYRLLLIA